MKTSFSLSTASGLSKKVITVWQGTGRSEVGQAEAMACFQGEKILSSVEPAQG